MANFRCPNNAVPELAHVLQDLEEKLNGFVAIHFICSLFIRIQKQSRY